MVNGAMSVLVLLEKNIMVTGMETHFKCSRLFERMPIVHGFRIIEQENSTYSFGKA